MPEPIAVRHLAQLMSTVPRWGGRTIVPFTVLQHVIACGRLAQTGTPSPIQELACLLHDVEEGIIGADVARNHKTEEQRLYEDTVRQEVYKGLKLPYPDGDLMEYVKVLDDYTALAESEILLPPLQRIAVFNAHEGDTPDAEQLMDAAQVVWDVALMTRNEAVEAFTARVDELRGTSSVKSLSQRL